ncbi:flagellar basal body rod protein FlgB [Clostridiisalibacter paucivorans]|uniref:flagellar basal body rod protein FlgB n=1 Tax=Clostridiisalibacter paucivorans TaxID=408753 RepID=UPI000479F8D0|nr:flagellar basal body rod protein FlgB [Clostridiisalibacter paucivorans]
MINEFYGKINFLKKAMDGAWLRNEAISNNISNVNTPGYKRIKVDFEKILDDSIEKKYLELDTTNNRHINQTYDNKNFMPIVKKDNFYSTKKDGNNVNIDVEMANLAKNTVYYNALSRMASDEISKIKTIINGGR